ncbi:hypothetical protein RUM44_001116 [Polyplax serrata]|uniref:Condensin-2 complex subunit G2 n=1 Tax=Polyplax serrata TaxID=468196 RepID=A0ABR1B9Y2_POLSC
MAKRSKGVIYSDVFENRNLDIAGILRKCDNGKAYDALPAKEKEKLWQNLYNEIKASTAQEDDSINIIKVSLELVLCILTSTQSSLELSRLLMTYLNSEGFTVPQGLANSLSKLNEYWLAKIEEEERIPGMEYNTLKHLLTLCTAEKPLATDIQRLSSIRKAISSTPFEKVVPSLKPLLIKLVETPFVLNSEHGQRFIAQAMVLSQKLMIDIHKTVMLELGTCNKKKSADYGKIYVAAWHGSSDEIRSNLEKQCFQHLMETFLREQRTSLELSKNSQNILVVLETWHGERKKKHPGFTTMITNAYQPILWKYLQSGFNMHRCNAADLLFKAFPLIRCEDNAIEAEKLFNMQYEAMLACLKDDCHIVRIIGIREICNILSHYWNSFNSVQIQSLMTVITKQNACDTSTAEVRRMVYIGLQSLVKSPLSCDYIKQILPILANNIHDVNQRVRIAFIQLLNCIKEKKDPTFKYSDVVSMGNIQYRLADDNAVVGQWIVKLLMKNYYHSKMPVVEWTKRFIYLIKTYRKSYRNFFFYSGKSLTFTDACTIIYEILSQLGMFVISKSGIDEEDSENIVQKPKEKTRGKMKNPLSEANVGKEPLDNSNSSTKKCAFDDPEVVLGLFDVVTILWVLHDIKLNKPENEETRLKLYDTYIKYAQPFINYYRNCDLFSGIIALSGNIPASLLRNNSITLPGYCIKMLKSLNLERTHEDNEKVICMLMALVKWGRGSEILEQITLWLDAAFETQNMNETILPRRRVKISETIQPNSIAAIHILNMLLKKEYAKLSILKKNYKELFHLWKFMSRIRQLIEVRIEQGEPFCEELVSDEFLRICFRRYVKLIPLLKEDSSNEEDKENTDENKSSEGLINHQKEIEDVLEWGDSFLYPLLQNDQIGETEKDLVVTLLEDILYVSDNMVIVHFVNNWFHFKLGRFTLKLLGSECAGRFVKAASRITAALNHSAKLLFNVSDDLNMFSTVIPSLVSHILNVLVTRNFSDKELEKMEDDLSATKINLSKVLATYQDNLKTPSNLKEKARELRLMVGLFADCIVILIKKKISDEESSVPTYSNTSQLPPIANVFITLFHNKKTWSSLFIYLVNAKLSAAGDDIKTVLACILLLNMYALSDKKTSHDELKKALSTATKKLNEMKRILKMDVTESSMEMDADRPLKDVEINNKEVSSETLVADTNVTEDTSKDMSVSSRDDQNQSDHDNSAESKENLSKKYFVSYGFKLINSIESALTNQMEVEQD